MEWWWASVAVSCLPTDPLHLQDHMLIAILYVIIITKLVSIPTYYIAISIFTIMCVVNRLTNLKVYGI